MKSGILVLFQLHDSDMSLKEWLRFVAALLQSGLHKCKSLVTVARRNNPNILWVCFSFMGLNES